MITKLVSRYLEQKQVPYSLLTHGQTFTALETAESAHISGKQLIKTLMVWIDGNLSMVLLPANYHLQTRQLAEALGANLVLLATEAEFTDYFEDCEPGALPAFGNLFDLKVYAADQLATQQQVCFSAGNHTQLIEMSWQDFYRLAKPELVTEGFHKQLTPPRMTKRRSRMLH